MSRNEYEQGTIKLPSAEFANVRKAVQAAVEADRQKMLETMTRAYNEAPPEALRSARAFREHLYKRKTVYGAWGRGSDYVYPFFNDEARDDMVDKMIGANGRIKTPRAAHLGPAPTNRTLSFSANGESSLTFDPAAKTVHWGVSQNNHAVDYARATVVYESFMKALDKVKWTRDTGGVITGNNEYHQDGGRGYEGGGGEYVTGAFGPIGAMEHPRSFVEFRDSAGVRHRVGQSSYAQKGIAQEARAARAMAKMLSEQARVAKGVPSGGQFSGRSRFDDNIRLR